ncbi:protein Red [Rhypophila decipiens]|uniref:Protein Red n=1 Tax=Rhypophila decipiens TaxID=261697 RepID=A0AAN6YG55_9PEZI|nr:protein Red [Rhypophila decipiens]
MNNDQFRRLVAANSTKSTDKNGDVSPSSTASPNGSSSRPAALGSRLKSSIPMTPRSVAGGAGRLDFARQLADRNNTSAKPAAKKARISAPKGTKFAAGYVDRAKTRQEAQDEQDEREQRIKALEDSLKKGEIDQATFDKLRSEIAGGDLASTHLVKGLDFKLLERIKRGEDVSSPSSKATEEEQPEAEVEEEEEEDPDALLEKLEAAEVKAIEREKVEKKGQIATTTLHPGQKRTRAQIIAELKASREAAKAKQQESSLGSKFKKIGAKKQPSTRIETDSRGREIMIIVDEDGNERRKVRRIDPRILEQQEKERQAEELAKTKGEVLGMQVPEFYKQQQEALRLAQEEKDKEITIFDDVESDYDPLAGLESDNDSSSSEDEDREDGEVKPPKEDKQEKKGEMLPPPPPKPPSAGPRNYFQDSKTGLTSQEEYKAPSLNDASFIAALKKAKAIAASIQSEEEQKNAEREARLRKKLAESARDDDDMDLGFGSSRVEDEADLREDKVKVSEWKNKVAGEDGDDDYDDDGGEDASGGGGKGKRKRKGKRKGDKNSFADVMAVMERQKKSAGS